MGLLAWGPEKVFEEQNVVGPFGPAVRGFFDLPPLPLVTVFSLRTTVVGFGFPRVDLRFGFTDADAAQARVNVRMTANFFVTAAPRWFGTGVGINISGQPPGILPPHVAVQLLIPSGVTFTYTLMAFGLTVE